MLSKKQKILAIIISVIVLSGITASVFAVNMGKKPEALSGGFSSPIADRLAIEVENTEFILKKSDDKPETFTLTCFISIKKTQADFYAVINSLTLENIAYDNIVFTALNAETEGKTLDSLELPAKASEPSLMEWKADITLTVSGKGTYAPYLLLDYESGITKASSAHKFLKIPLSVTVE